MALLDPVLYMPPLLVLIGVIYLLGSGQRAACAAAWYYTAQHSFTVRHVQALADLVFDSGYAEVAVAAGDALVLILWREVLPVIVPGILADATTRFITATYLLTSASFLGIIHTRKRGLGGNGA